MISLREGRWVCSFCGTECRGRDESCSGLDGASGCGAARQPGTRFFLVGQTPYLTDPDLIADAESGVDWHCDHCGGANKGAIGWRPVIACAHCGNARDEADQENEVRDYAPGAAPKSADELRSRPERPDPSPKPGRPVLNREGRLVSRARRPVIRGVAVLLTLIAVLFLGWSVLFAAYPSPATVTAISWERTLTVEAFRTVTDEGWNAPSDARIRDRDRRVRSWRSVPDGTETRTRQVSERVQVGTESYTCGTRDLGNGYFQDRTCTRPVYQTRTRTETYQEPVYRQEPVYDTWLSWEVDRWVPDRNLTATGETADRSWPVATLAENERSGPRSERLSVYLSDETGPIPDRIVSEEVWTAAAQDRDLIVTRDWWGRVRSVNVPDNEGAGS